VYTTLGVAGTELGVSEPMISVDVASVVAPVPSELMSTTELFRLMTIGNFGTTDTVVLSDTP